MSRQDLFRHTDFQFQRVCFKAPVKNAEKLYVCAASLDDTSGPGVFLQTPKMRVQDVIDKEKKCFIDLDVDDDGFYQLLRYLDTHIIQHVFRNREAWFNRDMNMAAVEDCYKSPIQKGKDGPVVRFKLNVVEGKQHTAFFVNKKAADVSILADKPSVVAIVQLRGLVMNKGSIVPDWVVHMIRSDTEVARLPRFHELALDGSASESVETS